ncbi:transcription factor Ouib [Drosophila grimshawi]|uniref:transcription factor Ouib n=1 Tax=Drosophila grimshawi TaxID=7222 RepID=UPI0013EEF113|nr:transcription factor Ouib [Drosophila grimshawi]
MVKYMCRVCGAYAAQEDSLKIFENPDILFSIKALTALVLENAECLPKLICNSCQKELQDAIKFSERLIAVQKRLLSALSEKELQQVSEDYREAVKDSSGKRNHNATNINQPTAVEELIIKQEEHEIFVDEEVELQGSESSETIENTFDEYQFAIDNHDYEKSVGYILPDKGSDEVLEVLDRVLKVDPDDKQFVCNRSELKHHMSTHPDKCRYPCQYCKRSFKDCDSRINHERTHTHERPYPCEICSKNFTTKYVLQNHMVTHSGLRSYR